MPNWCSNVLLAAGEPEAVAEFRILNAQHTEKGDPYQAPSGHLSNPWAQVNVDPVSRFNEQLVGARKANDISFTAMTKREGKSSWENNWGTKLDVANEARNIKPDRGSWKTPNNGVEMGRLEQWGMDTEWNPPERWLESVAIIFKDISLSLGYSEDGNGEFGVFFASGNEFSEKNFKQSRNGVAPKTIDMAISQGRKSMPMHRKPNALLRAIWEDNDKALISSLSRKTIDQIDEELCSRWSAIMHAAFAGSTKVAKILLDAGANPLDRIELGGDYSFGFSDICLDINMEQKPELVFARQNIFLAAIKNDARVAKQALGSGRDVLTMALLYQMGPLIRPLFDHCPLVIRDKGGGNNGCVNALVKGFPVESIQGLLSLIKPGKLKDFSNQIVTSLIESHTPGVSGGNNDSQTATAAARLFMHMHDNGLVSQDQYKIACKESPVKCEENDQKIMVGDAFSASIASERARRAIDKVMATSIKPSLR